MNAAAVAAHLAGITEHELVGIDGTGQLCSCGDKRRSWRDHLAEIAIAPFATTRADIERKRRARYAREWYARNGRTPKPDALLTRTRRILAEIAAESEALGRLLDATGLTDFAERADWLIYHDPWWHRKHGWDRHPSTERNPR